jgi:predicted Zn-dependent protease
MIARVLLAACALVIAAGLAVSLRSQHYLDRATRIATGTAGARPAAQIGTLEATLREADRHTPSTRARVLLANVEVARGRTGRAVALLRPVLREEPENIQAWSVLAAAGVASRDRRTVAAAQRRIHQLSPLTP